MSYNKPPSDIDEMSTLKVDNLTYRTTIEQLKRLFDKFGDIGDIYIPRDHRTKESRGFAFVRFYEREDAEDALDEMDGQMYDGRPLRVQVARYSRPDQRRGYSGGGGGRRGGRSRSRDRRRRSRSRDKRRSRSRDRRSRSRDRKSRSRDRKDRRSSRGRSNSASPKQNGDKDQSRSRSRSRPASEEANN